jgi:hypothetical protein
MSFSRAPRVALTTAALGLLTTGCIQGGGGDGGGGPAAVAPVSASTAAQTAADTARLHLGDLAADLEALRGAWAQTPLFDVLAEGVPEARDLADGGDLTRLADDLAGALTELLTEESVESDDGRTVVYRPSSDAVCLRLLGEGDDDLPTCVARLDAEPLRVRVTSPAEGDLDLSAEIAGARPLVVGLHRDRVRVALDLAALQRAADALAQAGGDAPFVGTLRGAVEAEAVRGPAGYALTLALPQGLQIAAPDRVDARIATSRVTARLDREGPALSVEVATGAVTATVWDRESDSRCDVDARGEVRCVDAPVGDAEPTTLTVPALRGTLTADPTTIAARGVHLGGPIVLEGPDARFQITLADLDAEARADDGALLLTLTRGLSLALDGRGDGRAVQAEITAAAPTAVRVTDGLMQLEQGSLRATATEADPVEVRAGECFDLDAEDAPFAVVTCDQPSDATDRVAERRR